MSCRGTLQFTLPPAILLNQKEKLDAARFCLVRRPYPNAVPMDPHSVPAADVARGGAGSGPHADPLGRRRPDREGLLGTPDRVVRSYAEFFSGYGEDPVALLQRTFEETDGYDEIVALKDIRFESHCEHHIAPIIGKVHVAYLPNNRVVGISKLARLVEVYAKRLQIQEKMTAQIANTLDEVLQPKGVAVVIEAAHQCMTTRGVHKPGVTHGDEPDARRLPRRPAQPARSAGDDRHARRRQARQRLIMST